MDPWPRQAALLGADSAWPVGAAPERCSAAPSARRPLASG